jgi:hypothetical protein
MIICNPNPKGWVLHKDNAYRRLPFSLTLTDKNETVFTNISRGNTNNDQHKQCNKEWSVECSYNHWKGKTFSRYFLMHDHYDQHTNATKNGPPNVHIITGQENVVQGRS